MEILKWLKQKYVILFIVLLLVVGVFSIYVQNQRSTESWAETTHKYFDDWAQTLAAAAGTGVILVAVLGISNDRRARRVESRERRIREIITWANSVLLIKSEVLFPDISLDWVKKDSDARKEYLAEIKSGVCVKRSYRYRQVFAEGKYILLLAERINTDLHNLVKVARDNVNEYDGLEDKRAQGEGTKDDCDNLVKEKIEPSIEAVLDKCIDLMTPNTKRDRSKNQPSKSKDVGENGEKPRGRLSKFFERPAKQVVILIFTVGLSFVMWGSSMSDFKSPTLGAGLIAGGYALVVLAGAWGVWNND